ncbi:hypothetical protein M405DRAFT_934241, partial [Rhizopogon salebrosus TDB-379]
MHSPAAPRHLDATTTTPTPPRFLQWARNPFSNTRDGLTKASSCMSTAEGADDSLEQATPRYYSQKGVKMEKEKTLEPVRN